LWRQTGERPPQLDGPECPAGFDQVWRDFAELSAQRRSGWSGIEPLQYEELAAWARLTRREIGFIEVDYLLALDREFRKLNTLNSKSPRS